MKLDRDGADDPGVAVAQWLSRTLVLYRQIRAPADVMGVGVIVTRRGPAGLLMVRRDADPTLIDEIRVERSAERPLSLLDIDPPALRNLLRRRRDQGRVRGLVGDDLELALEADVRLLPMNLPRAYAAVQSGGEIYGVQTKLNGTAGVALRRVGQQSPEGVLAAGHVAGDVAGAAVEVVTRGLLGFKHAPLGSVVAGRVPTGSSGLDASIVDVVGSGSSVTGLAHRGVANFGAVMPAPRGVSVYGAVSGLGVAGLIVGAMAFVQGGGYAWDAVWLMSPSGLVRQGDSGAAVVLTSTQELLGTFVGGASIPGHVPLAVQYVQDLDLVARRLLSPAGWEVC